MSENSEFESEKNGLSYLINTARLLKSDFINYFQSELNLTATKSKVIFQRLHLGLFALILGVALSVCGITSAILLIAITPDSNSYYYAWALSVFFILLGAIALLITKRLITQANLCWRDLSAQLGVTLHNLELQDEQEGYPANNSANIIMPKTNKNPAFENLKSSVNKFRADFSGISKSVINMFTWGTEQINTVDKIIHSPQRTPWIFFGSALAAGALLGARNQNSTLPNNSTAHQENGFIQPNSLMSSLKEEVKIQASTYISTALLNILNGFLNPKEKSNPEESKRN